MPIPKPQRRTQIASTIYEMYSRGEFAEQDWKVNWFPETQYFMGTMLDNYGDMCFLCRDEQFITMGAAFFRRYNEFCALYQSNYEKMLTALNAQYNPVENYNREEQTSTGNTYGDKTTTPTGITSSNYKHDQNTVTYNTASYDDVPKAASSTDNPDTTGYTEQRFTDHEGNNPYSITETKGDDGQIVISSIHGNIGVTTNQQMITEELNLRRYNILLRFVSDFVRTYCVTTFDD